MAVFASFVVLLYPHSGHTGEHIFLFAVVVLLYCSVLWVVFGTIRYMSDESKMELIGKNAEYLQGQLALARENELTAKTIRHDFRHHNRNIAVLLQKGDIKKVLRYIEQYNGAYGKFTGIEIDGNAVSTEDYTAKSGSTVITLKPDYLNTLAAEEHAITVLYTDGETQGTFTVAEKPAEPTDTTETTDDDSASPETGDDFHMVSWIMLLLISGGAALTLSARRRSK